MKGKAAAAGVLLLLVSSALLWAGDPWKKKPYPDWDYYDVEEVLTNSPWSRAVKIGGGSFLVFTRHGGPAVMGTPAQKIDAPGGPIVVRWFSASTVREACVRSNQLARVVPEERAQQLLSRGPEHFIIAVGLWSFGADPFFDPVDQALPNPGGVFLELLAANRKIPPIKYQRLGGTDLYYFPREENGQPVLGPEKRVKFSVRLKGTFYSVTFDLGKMVRDGKPDL